MTLKDKVCASGANTLAEYLCMPNTGGTGTSSFTVMGSDRIVDEKGIRLAWKDDTIRLIDKDITTLIVSTEEDSITLEKKYGLREHC